MIFPDALAKRVTRRMLRLIGRTMTKEQIFLELFAGEAVVPPDARVEFSGTDIIVTVNGYKIELLGSARRLN